MELSNKYSLSSNPLLAIYEKTTQMKIITETVLTGIKGNRRVIGRLVTAFNKHYRTIENWIVRNDHMLTTPDAIKIISEETGLTQDQILEETELVNQDTEE